MRALERSIEIEERLRLDYRHLVRIRRERMNMEFTSSCFEVHIAERLKAVRLGFRERHEHAAIAGKFFKIGMALAIEVRTHLLYLEVGHIAKAPTYRALMRIRTTELKMFYQATVREHLSWRGDDFA